MGFLSKFFPRQREQSTSQTKTGYTTFTEYAPHFTSWDGTLYEQLLTRTAVERFAVACSSLKPEVVGNPSTKPKVRNLFDTRPNEYQTWPSFLKRAATLLDADTTLFVVAEVDGRDQSVTGLHVVKPTYTEICEYKGEPYAIFHLRTGTMAIEWRYVCVVTRFQYESDYFGGGNLPLNPTLALMDAQRQAEDLAMKNGARIRFIGKVTSMTHEDDLRKKRDRFAEDNLGPNNTSGLMVYDTTFDKVEQVKEDRFTLDPEEMERIENNVFDYFGTNRKILQNSFTEEEWNAYYEGRVEPFAVALADGLTSLLYTQNEQKRGNRVMLTSNRLQYASTSTKRAVIADLMDRGVMSINQALEIMQLPPIPGGDLRLVRGEFYLMDEEGNVVVQSGGIQDGEEIHDKSVTDIDFEEYEEKEANEDAVSAGSETVS